MKLQDKGLFLTIEKAFSQVRVHLTSFCLTNLQICLILLFLQLSNHFLFATLLVKSERTNHFIRKKVFKDIFYNDDNRTNFIEIRTKVPKREFRKRLFGFSLGHSVSPNILYTSTLKSRVDSMTATEGGTTPHANLFLTVEIETGTQNQRRATEIIRPF